MQLMPCAFVFDLANAGNSIPARIAMMAMTTSSSIRVNPLREAVRRDETTDREVFITNLAGFRMFLALRTQGVKRFLRAKAQNTRASERTRIDPRLLRPTDYG